MLSRFSWTAQWLRRAVVRHQRASTTGFAHSWQRRSAAASANQLDWYQLVQNTRYYVRVNTLQPRLAGQRHDYLRDADLHTLPSITAPTNLDADTIEQRLDQVRVEKGVDNLWFCVDTAESEADLNGLTRYLEDLGLRYDE